jgi:hypothetical protein
MLVINLYDDLDFKCHFRLTRSSVEVCKLIIKISKTYYCFQYTFIIYKLIS